MRGIPVGKWETGIPIVPLLIAMLALRLALRTVRYYTGGRGEDRAPGRVRTAVSGLVGVAQHAAAWRCDEEKTDAQSAGAWTPVSVDDRGRTVDTTTGARRLPATHIPGRLSLAAV